MTFRVTDAHQLFTEHRQGVFRYLCRMIGQPEMARDLTQDVFLRVSRARVPDAGADGRRAWVFKIARNLALNHLRDAHRRPQSVELIDSVRPATQELSAALGQAIDALGDVERDVFLMREAGGLSYGEIASACELTTDAVRSRLHRARQQLRKTLGGSIHVHGIRGVRIDHG